MNPIFVASPSEMVWQLGAMGEETHQLTSSVTLSSLLLERDRVLATPWLRSPRKVTCLFVLGYERKPSWGTSGYSMEPSSDVWFRMSVGAPESVRYVMVDTIGNRIFIWLEA